VDEISFGSSRQARRLSRRWRAIAVAVSIAGAGAAGTALAVTAASSQHAATPQQPASRSAALPAPVRLLPLAACPPARPAWPNMARLPVGMRPGALPVIVDAQFSGRCTAP
jgi:hypothetical protein